MNLELNPSFYHHPFPERVEISLTEHGVANVKFSRRGNLLAGGCFDGRCVVWDFDTMQVIRVLVAHTRAVNGIRDVLLLTFRNQAPLVLDWRTGEQWNVPGVGDNVDANDTAEKQAQFGDLVATWDPKGFWVYIGTAKHGLTIVNARTRAVDFSSTESFGSVRQLSFSRDGRDLVTLSNDKILRYFTVPEETRKPRAAAESSENTAVFEPPIPIHEFQDPVTRVGWKACSFNATGKYVIGGVESRTETNFYIWDKITGVLNKILEGPKEGLEAYCWHPYRAVIVNVTAYYTINVWSNMPTEKWSAFAPDFRELEENVEYDEREDEFDITDEDTGDAISSGQKYRRNGITTAAPLMSNGGGGDGGDHEAEDEAIDIFTVSEINPYGDSDSELEEDRRCGMWRLSLPLHIELEEEEQTPSALDNNNNDGAHENGEAADALHADASAAAARQPSGTLNELNEYIRGREALSSVTLQPDDEGDRKRTRDDEQPEAADGENDDDVIVIDQQSSPAKSMGDGGQSSDSDAKRQRTA
ncbi:chromatin binding protein [Sorochytrium milnesiophthora]